MKIDFEVIEPKLGKNLHLYKFMKIDKAMKRTFPNIGKLTWGSEAFIIAKNEIADFDAFPELDDNTEGTFVKAVVGKINGQIYATVVVFCDGGVDTGHPLLIE